MKITKENWIEYTRQKELELQIVSDEKTTSELDKYNAQMALLYLNLDIKPVTTQSPDTIEA